MDKMNMVELTSLQNEVVKEIAALNDKKNRQKTGLIVLEGEKSIQGAIEAGLELESIFFENDKYVKSAKKMYKVNEKILEKITTTKSAAPVLATIKKPQRSLSEFKKFKKIAVFENIKDAGNLGTILRSAVAFGIEGLILSGDCVDEFSPKTIRSSVGTIFKIPVIHFDIKDFEEFQKTHEFISTVVCGGKSLGEFKFPEKFLLFFGSEAEGLSANLEKLCTEKITVKMTKNAESLNLSVSAGIIFNKIFNA